MKNTKKRGFTIVELVIVIAVIAILASALIPTFSGVVKKAKEFADLQNARNAWLEYVANQVTSSGDGVPADLDEGKITKIKSGNGTFYADGMTFLGAEQPEGSTVAYECTVTKGKITARTPAQSGGEGAGGGNNQGGGQG
ncbi:MAG: type II secretion system GspH family protein [Eubacterium sp.]|nr:type II secretion system GspH family protein [Eubacterium sp.]